ncbi:hypothetical protein FKM82_006944 [Ascaphus truei]
MFRFCIYSRGNSYSNKNQWQFPKKPRKHPGSAGLFSILFYVHGSFMLTSRQRPPPLSRDTGYHCRGLEY